MIRSPVSRRRPTAMFHRCGYSNSDASSLWVPDWPPGCRDEVPGVRGKHGTDGIDMTGRTGGRPCTANRADPLRSGHPVAAAASTREQAEPGRTLAATALEPMRHVAKVLRPHSARRVASPGRKLVGGLRACQL